MLRFLFKGKPHLRIVVGAVIIGISLALSKSLLEITSIGSLLRPAPIAIVLGSFLIVQAFVELVRRKMSLSAVSRVSQQRASDSPQTQEDENLSQPSQTEQ